MPRSGHARVALEARLAIAATALLGATLTSGDVRSRIVGVMLGLYLPYAAVVSLLERRPAPASRVLAAVADHLVVFAVAVALPELRVAALLAYGLATTYHAVTSGAVLGAGSATLATGLAVLAEVVADAAAVGGFTLVMFAGAQAALVRVVTVLTRERRELAVQLARLDLLVSRQARAPDTPSALAAVASTAAAVLGADGAYVALDDGALPGGESGCEARHGERPPTNLHGSLDELLAQARAAGEPVIWRTRDRRWAVAVALRTTATDLGVAAAWGDGRLTPTSEALLAAFADHAVAALLRVSAEGRQRQALRRLEEVEQIRDEVITTLSHEIRTPLTATTSFLYILDTYWDRLDEDVRRTMVGQARGSSDVLGRLVSRIMDFARFEQQTRLVAPLEIELSAAVRRAVDRRSAGLAEHPVRVVVPPGCLTLADPEALDRILGNLLENAAAYTPAGSAIEVRGDVGAEQVTVTVRDEGPGIAPDDLAHVFDPLFRGHQPVPGVPGTGTGLTVVRRLVELLGGRVWVESEPGAGATFGFTLPLADASQEASSLRGPAVPPGSRVNAV